MWWSSGWIRLLLVLLSVAIALPVYAMCAPFVLLSLHVLPGLGIGGVVYVAAGAVAAIPIGAWSALRTLRQRGTRWPSHYLALQAVHLAIIAACLAAARWFDAFLHV